ncbi:MAG: hypothetical protein QW292_05730 [Candidatus Parvarchaeota archaeon]
MLELRNNDFRIHIIVGITGHRDIVPQDVSTVMEKIRKFFNELKRKLPNTPLLLLTPLAEGADRIAAQVAIEEEIKFIAPFPLPEEHYKDDFPRTIEEFDDLKRKALGYFELTLEDCDRSVSRPRRDKRYEEVGAFIVKHSQVLLTLWDGKDSGLIGGTSQIVGFKLNGLPIEYTSYRTVLDSPDNGPVYHIHTRRMRDFDPALPYSPEMKWLWPEGTDEETFFGRDGIFTRFDTFNREIKELDAKEVQKSRQNLASDVAEKEKFVSHVYAEADVIAINLKRRWNFFQTSLLVTVGILFAIFLGYAFLHILGLLVLYVAAYIVLALLFRVRNVLHRFHQSFVEYRALAEGLRVEFFLRLAGNQEDVADHYLRKHRRHLQWVREVLRSANVFDPQEMPDFAGNFNISLTQNSRLIHRRCLTLTL